jgi:hypothetical protein
MVLALKNKSYWRRVRKSFAMQKRTSKNSADMTKKGKKETRRNWR